MLMLCLDTKVPSFLFQGILGLRILVKRHNIGDADASVVVVVLLLVSLQFESKKRISLLVDWCDGAASQYNLLMLLYASPSPPSYNYSQQ